MWSKDPNQGPIQALSLLHWVAQSTASRAATLIFGSLSHDVRRWDKEILTAASPTLIL